jgi:hypothetical protein
MTGGSIGWPHLTPECRQMHELQAARAFGPGRSRLRQTGFYRPDRHTLVHGARTARFSTAHGAVHQTRCGHAP